MAGDPKMTALLRAAQRVVKDVDRGKVAYNAKNFRGSVISLFPHGSISNAALRDLCDAVAEIERLDRAGDGGRDG